MKLEPALLIATLLLLAGGPESIAACQPPCIEISEEGIPRLQLPQALVDAIGRELPGYRIPGAEDLRDRWLGYANESRLPYAAWGDFNGDGLIDVALILVSSDRWTVQSFHQQTDGGYQAHDLESFAGESGAFVRDHPPQEFALFVVSAGEDLVALDSTLIEDFRHPFDAIILTLLRAPESMQIYHWSPEGHQLYGISAMGFFTD
jgi:hypothetical protein